MTKPATTAPEQKGSIVKDPEIVAVDKICGLLQNLAVVPRRRVLKYITDKFIGDLPCEVPPKQVPPGQSDPRD